MKKDQTQWVNVCYRHWHHIRFLRRFLDFRRDFNFLLDYLDAPIPTNRYWNSYLFRWKLEFQFLHVESMKSYTLPIRKYMYAHNSVHKVLCAISSFISSPKSNFVIKWYKHFIKFARPTRFPVITMYLYTER